jgi:ubiquinone biosynthesis protein UbiJ
MPPLAAARLFAGDQAARREARISGDQALAETVAMIVDNLKWDVEEDLSRVVGDIAAHRLSEGLSTLMTWQRSAAESVGRNLTEYWVEEDPLIASRHRVAQFADSVDQLRDDVERLSRRIDLLQRARD